MEMEMSRRWLLVVFMVATMLADTCSSRCDYPAIFNFGDSTSDTGEIHNTFPGNELAEKSPFGRTFFGQPTGRYSDGRLAIDFMSEALGIPFLDPYLKAVGANFSHGVNFAAAGATAWVTDFIAPISLTVQLGQFKLFKEKVLQRIKDKGVSGTLPTEEAFKKGLYVIQIGGNDFSYGYMTQKMTPAQVEASIVPGIVKAVTGAVETLYNEGARTILVWDIAPQGCQSFWLAMFPHSPTDFDRRGCATPYNKAVRVYDRLLKMSLGQLRKRLGDANIVYVDTYKIMYSLVSRPGRFGFQYTTMACCGVGKYNYTYSIPCGIGGVLDGKPVFADSCADPSAHLLWDGVHWTEQANRIVTRQILQGTHFDPPSFSLSSHCDLNMP